VRKQDTKGPERRASGEPDRYRFLGYGFPRVENDNEFRVSACELFELHDHPLKSSASFLDFDGVVIFAGAFERLGENGWGEAIITCAAPADLDLREREFFSAIKRGTPFVFLIHDLAELHLRTDLFRRVATQLGVAWGRRESPCSVVESLHPEFREYVTRFGTGYLELGYKREDSDWVKPICSASQNLYGVVVFGTVFFLPCTMPQTHEQTLEMARAAIAAVIAYRRRMSKELPEWTTEFAFAQESALRAQANDLHCQVVQIEGQIDSYILFKGALAYQSTPLVEVVDRLLRRFFDISPTIDDKCIEDATLQDGDGNILAVFEIKGVKGNFTRANVNQVDSHRERLKLPATVPGVLIMNTLMGANSLQEKDQAPHPDIIQKAVADRVLLIRTLDLLCYADGVERGVFKKEAFKQTLLGESGWLKVENDVAQVMIQ
jgi:hypothetical protein